MNHQGPKMYARPSDSVALHEFWRTRTEQGRVSTYEELYYLGVDILRTRADCWELGFGDSSFENDQARVSLTHATPVFVMPFDYLTISDEQQGRQELAIIRGGLGDFDRPKYGFLLVTPLEQVQVAEGLFVLDRRPLHLPISQEVWSAVEMGPEQINAYSQRLIVGLRTPHVA